MKILPAILLPAAAIAVLGCSNIHLVRRGSSAAAQTAATSVSAVPAAPAAMQVTKVTLTKPLAVHATVDPWANVADRIVARVVALKRTDQRVAIPAKESASAFERRLTVLVEEGLTKNGFHIPPTAPLAPAAEDRIQLAVLNLETSLTLGTKPAVEVIARVVDRGDVVLACVETLPVSPKDLSLFQPSGTYLGRDQNLHENPVKNFKIIRGE